MRSGKRTSLQRRTIEDEIALLRDLDLKGLRTHWQNEFGRAAPEHLTRYLLFRILAYRIQADRLGDLDAETLKILARSAGLEDQPSGVSRELAELDQRRSTPPPVGPRSGMGPEIPSGDDLAGRFCLERQHLRQSFSSRLCHHRDQVERPPLLRPAGSAPPTECWRR